MNQIPQWQQSPRVAITRGTVVAFKGGGPEYDGAQGPHRLTLPGLFLVRDIVKQGRRVWLEVRGIGRTAGTFLVFVSGRAYRREDLPGILWRPYRVRRQKAKATRPSNKRKAVA